MLCCSEADPTGETVTKSDRDIVEILEPFDLTRSAWSAAQLTGCDPKTVQRYVELRDGGHNPYERVRRPGLIDPFLEKVEEWVEASQAKIRADVAHRKLVAMGFTGTQRSTRRAVAEAKSAPALHRGPRVALGQPVHRIRSQVGSSDRTASTVVGSSTNTV